MGDTGDVFRAWKQERIQKRASNRASSAAMLTERGVAFEDKNDGAHLIVRHAGKVIDFWPGTGKWIDRAFAQHIARGRGIRSLLRFIECDDIHHEGKP